jgi:high-affinity iron transporter
MTVNVFAVPIFFIVFREVLECCIVVSVLLSFLKQTLGNDPAVHKKLRAQVWWGVGLGFLLCLIIGGAFIGAFYGLGECETRFWDGK